MFRDTGKILGVGSLLRIVTEPDPYSEGCEYYGIICYVGSARLGITMLGPESERGHSWDDSVNTPNDYKYGDTLDPEWVDSALIGSSDTTWEVILDAKTKRLT